ncbi:MAG: DEAD/DEAH box helicase [Desulfatibacillaceae bacterium]
MIVLHAAYAEDSLVIWGEQSPAGDSPEDSADAAAKKGQKAAARPHPFSAGGTEVARIVRESSSGIGITVRRAKNAVVWLPGGKESPSSSSPLVEDGLSPDEELTLSSWTVPACPLKPGEAVEFLCVATDRRILAPGVVLATDLAWFTQLLRFAGSIVARQQYLPTVALSAKTCRALWEPVYAGRDAERLTALAAAMPPAARALSMNGAAAPPDDPSIKATRAFINDCVDHLVRFASTDRKAPGKAGDKSYDSLHDAWLDALATPDGQIRGQKAETWKLAAQVGRWRRPMRVMTASPYRMFFRLEEPPEDAPTDDGGKHWYVRYLLSPHDDPSLLIPVSEAWRAKGKKAGALKRKGAKLPEFILSSLGQAAGICPHVARSLKAARPTGYHLDTAGAHEFLTQTAHALEQSGFAVLLPAWWTRRGTRARLAARASVSSAAPPVGAGLTLNTLVDFDWKLSLGDEQCTLEELEELASMKTPLVRVRGQWVEMDPDTVSEAIRFLKDSGSRKASVLDLVGMAIGTRNQEKGIAFEGVEAKGWMKELLDQLHGQASYGELRPPGSFSGTLRPYQIRGYSWLAFLRQWGFGACLADDMGLGKTIQALALVARDRELGENRPVLLICPTSVVANWKKEAARFTPDLPVVVHHGVNRKKGAAFKRQAEKHAMVVSSYGLIQRDLKFLNEMDWAGVILDEAQNIKNPETKQSRAARSLVADYRIALTGTPVENNVGDLWSIMDFLNPGFLGTQTSFRKNFFVPIQAAGDPEASRRLSRITGPFILRRLKTDKTIISDLPEKMETRVYCTLTREQASLYAAVLADLEEKMHGAEGIERKGLILATLSKLKQVCNHPAHFLDDNSRVPGRSGKLARLTEMVEEILENRDKALIFTQFSRMGGILQRHLQSEFGEEVMFLHGQVPKNRRDRMVERFQDEDGRGPSLFILSLKAGGTGLNLTRANHVFHFDRWWNPAVEDQATDRAFRIGQKKNVQVHKYICVGTLEDKIDAMIERKKDLAEKVVGTGEGWLCQLSDEELREIFALRKESVGD